METDAGHEVELEDDRSAAAEEAEEKGENELEDETDETGNGRRGQGEDTAIGDMRTCAQRVLLTLTRGY